MNCFRSDGTKPFFDCRADVTKIKELIESFKVDMNLAFVKANLNIIRFLILAGAIQ